MNKQDTITFFVDLSLKEEFKSKAKSAGFTMSSALVQFMKRFIEDQRIISISFNELQERVNQTISKVETDLQEEFACSLSKLSKYVDIIEKQVASIKETTKMDLKDEIKKIIQSDESVRAER